MVMRSQMPPQWQSKAATDAHRRGEGLETAGGGGNDGRMEARVSNLEKTMGDVRERLASVDAKVGSIETHGAKSSDLASLRTDIATLESRMIRWFVGSALAIGGIAFAIARFIS